jgi:general L-amino acid transport system permease protein
MISASSSAAMWARRNLFAAPLDVALTLLFVPLALWAVYSFGYWALAVARWDVVQDSMRVFLVGTLLPTEIWRAWVALLLVSLIIGSSIGLGFAFRARPVWSTFLVILLGASLVAGKDPLTLVAFAVLGTSLISSWAIVSRFAPLPSHIGYFVTGALAFVFMTLAPAGMDRWGGLLLSVIVTLVSAFFIIFFGVLLAFGRRSRILAVRLCCTAYIELMRSLPLILIVYWIWLAGPLFFPNWNLASVLRGIVGFVVYFAAVAAESVRGGLQSVPRGQEEAARSLALSDFDVSYQILLPQALRAALPALVGNILDVFNFVPIVFIIGLSDFLRTGEMVLASPQFSNRTYEVYVFMLLVYFAIGSVLTLVARGLEHRLARGSRRLY